MGGASLSEVKNPYNLFQTHKVNVTKVENGFVIETHSIVLVAKTTGEMTKILLKLLGKDEK